MTFPSTINSKWIMKSKLSLFLVFSFIFSCFSPLPVFAQAEETYPEYVVQSGDTLGGIASLFSTTTDELIQLNAITDPNSIYPGLQLKIPGLAGMSGVISPVVVGLGESWQNILTKYHADAELLIKLNQLTSLSDVCAGYQLLMPVSTEEPAYSPIGVTDQARTLIENAVLLDANPTTLLMENDKRSSLDFFTHDLIFGSLDEHSIANPASSELLALTITPLPIKQGKTISIHIQTNQPMSLEGELAGYKLSFYSPDDVNYYALQGINAMAETGITDFSLSGSIGSAQVFSYQQSIYLSPGVFDVDPPIQVSADTIDPAVTVPEFEQVSAITAVITPEQYWNGLFLSPDNDYSTVIPNYAAQKEITSYFGSRRTYNDNPEVTFHTGIDFGGGQTLPIVAPADGKVVFADFLTVRGNATIIDHGLGVYSAFYHQSEILVKEGDRVVKGQQIGIVGNTGRVERATEYEGAGSHMHWEMWVGGVQVNPLDWLNSEYP